MDDELFGLREGPVIITVAGLPITQGSKRAWVHNDKVVLLESGGDRHRLWRHAVNDQARAVWTGPPLAGPVELHATFRLKRPKSHPKRRRTWPTGRNSGDLSKLARSIEDSLTGVAFLDDSQIVREVIEKDWATEDVPPGVIIVIKEVADEA